VFIAVDYALVLAVCAATPQLTTSAELVQDWGTQQAIAASAIVSFAVVLPVHISLPMAALIVGTYAWGAASVVGFQTVAAMASSHCFVLALAMSVLLRVRLLRVAQATKWAPGNDRSAGDVRKRVAVAARRYEREQAALLHDTAASTLLLVGNGTPISRHRLSAQANSGLAALNAQPLAPPPQRIDLVAALRELASGMCTRVRFRGSPQLWLDGKLGTAVVAAVREAINNVDRHAGATEISVEVAPDRVVVTDNGSGFTGGSSTSGHGIAESIVGRMERAGAIATIHSVPGRGTAVELSWTDAAHYRRSPESDTGADGLSERIRLEYGRTLVVLALLTLILAAQYSINRHGNPAAQLALAALAALSYWAALPALRYGRRASRWFAIAVLLVVTGVQPALLAVSLPGESAQWSLWATGWCLLPLVLGLPLRTSIAILSVNWVAAYAVTLAQDPPIRILVGLLLLGAHLVVVQVLAQIAHAVIVDAAASAHAERQAHLDAVTREQVGAALDAGFQRRYADVRRSVIPLLTRLSRGEPIDTVLRQQARAQCQRIRTLLDQPHAVEHPLLCALQPAVTAAVNRNVNVDVHVQSELPELAEADAEQLIEAISRLMRECTAAVRIVLTTMDNELIVSVVCRGHDYNGNKGWSRGVTATDGKVEIVKRNDTTWLTIRHQIRQASPDDVLEYDRVF